MISKESSISKAEFGGEQDETVPERFPVVRDDEIYYSDRMPEWQEDKIIHFVKGALGGGKEGKKNCFMLLKTIAGLHYHFYLAEYFGAHIMSFKTEEYEYATVNLDKKSQEVLAKTLSAFLESIADYTNDNIKEIHISPAPASYSAEEIETCIDAVLSAPNNKLSRKQLFTKYNGFRVFDLYHELFGKNFLPIHYNEKSRAMGRSRLFKMMAKKYLQNWEVSEEPGFSLGSDFRLKRKNEDTIDTGK